MADLTKYFVKLIHFHPELKYNLFRASGTTVANPHVETNFINRIQLKLDVCEEVFMNLTRSVCLAILLIGAYPSVYGNALGNFGRFLGDVASLGQTGRDRDKQHAEQQAAQAKKDADAAEKQRQQDEAERQRRIAESNNIIEFLQRVDQQATEVLLNLETLQVLVGEELTRRNDQYYYVEQATDYFRGYSGGYQDLLGVLVYIGNFTQSEETEWVNGWQTSIERLGNLAEMQGKSVDQFLTDTIQNIKTNELNSINEMTTQVSVMVMSLHQDVQTRWQAEEEKLRSL